MNNKNELKLSIITVCYNSAKTIEQTIKSVITQSYPNIEYIIVDGGSTDGTLEIIKKYETHIATWISESDGGIYDAMNKGIRLATGDVVGIINSDDWYAEGALEKVATFFKAHSEVQASYGDYISISVSEKERHRAVTESPLMDYPHPTMFVRRYLYDKIGNYDTSYQVCADSDFMFRCQCAGISFYYIPQLIAYFRVRGFSRTVRSNKLPREIKRSWQTLKAQGRLSPARIKYMEKYSSKEREKYLLHYLLQQRMPRYGHRGAFFKSLLTMAYKENFIIWGAGADGIVTYRWFSGHEYLLAAFIDSNPERQLFRVERFPVLSPAAISDYNALVIVASSNYQEEIIDELESTGKRKGVDYISRGMLLKQAIAWYASQRALRL